MIENNGDLTEHFTKIFVKSKFVHLESQKNNSDIRKKVKTFQQTIKELPLGSLALASKTIWTFVKELDSLKIG